MKGIVVEGLRDLFALRGIKQARVAELLKIDSSVVSLWAIGRRAVPSVHIAPLAEILGVTVAGLTAGLPTPLVAADTSGAAGRVQTVSRAPACVECSRPMRRAKHRTRCQACVTHEQWRLGKFDNAVRKRWNLWSPQEDTRLREMAGRVATAEIATLLSAEFGTQRSPAAVHCRATVIGVYLSIDAWTQHSICRLFDANEATVQKRWLLTGLLRASRLPAGVGCRQGEWRVTESDLEAFIRRCPWAFDANRMQPASHRLARLARDLQRRDPWVTAEVARAYLGISEAAFVRWCRMGVIPSQRRAVGIQGGRGGSYVVRAADLPECRRIIHERQVAAREFIKTNLQMVMRERRAIAA